MSGGDIWLCNDCGQIMSVCQVVCDVCSGGEMTEKDGNMTETFCPLEELGIGDVNSDAKGSGARFNNGKPDYGLMPMHLFDEVAQVWEYGAGKYAAWNWAKGMPWAVPYACACRHLFAWFRGERNDPESGCSHLAHVICNMMMLIHYERFYPEGDNRPKEYFGE